MWAWITGWWKDFRLRHHTCESDWNRENVWTEWNTDNGFVYGIRSKYRCSVCGREWIE